MKLYYLQCKQLSYLVSLDEQFFGVCRFVKYFSGKDGSTPLRQIGPYTNGGK